MLRTILPKLMLLPTQLREDIESVFARDPAARNAWEVLTCYPGLQAIWLHRLAHYYWQNDAKWLGRATSHFNRWLTGIEIHPGAKLGKRLFIDHGMGVVIGETAEIGDDCTLYHGVTLGGVSWNSGKRHPTLGNGVVVGSGAKILGPFVVGDGARIGSNAVVVNAVPEHATVVGIPGKIIPKRESTGSDQALIAKRLGFEAYGMTRDLPDPVAQTFAAILQELQVLEEKVKALEHKKTRKKTVNSQT